MCGVGSVRVNALWLYHVKLTRSNCRWKRSLDNASGFAIEKKNSNKNEEMFIRINALVRCRFFLFSHSLMIVFKLIEAVVHSLQLLSKKLNENCAENLWNSEKKKKK